MALVSILVLMSVGGGMAPAADTLLIANGRSAYVIVLPDDPIPSERTAARELQEHLAKSTDVVLPIVSERKAARAKARILLGQGAAVKQAARGVDWAALGTDGIVLKTIGRDLVLTGGRPRGVLYAVYEFLEATVGCRWWDETTSSVPRHRALALPTLDKTYVPRIVCREPHFYLPNNDGVWAARNRANGHFNRVPVEFGGHMSILGWCHTFYSLIPPATHFGAHPEWFSERNGRRQADGGQLCLSNEEVRRELTRQALEWIRKDPSAGFISISQNDWDGHCMCEPCRAAEQEEGSPSGPLLRFVNAVAADIEKEYPTFRVETLAYQYTRKAPKVTKPRRNVTIRLCSIECDYGLPLSDPRNKAFRDDLEAWSAIAPQLFIWSYIASFGEYYHPNPTLPVYGPNIREFADHRAVGVFMQGDSYNAASCFVRLRAWVIARLLWDPARREDRLIDEFLTGYYGAAAPHMRRYLALLQEAYSRRRAGPWMTPSDVLAGFDLFREAEAAVPGDAALLARVRRERLPLDYLWAARHRPLLMAAQSAGRPAPGARDPSEAIAALRDKALASKSLYRSEGQLAAPWLDAWLAQSKVPAAPPPADLGSLPAGSYVDLQEADLRLFGVGDWVSIVDDRAASNGKAARLTTHHAQWAVQVPFDGVAPGRYRIYLSVRGDVADPLAQVGTFGLYDSGRASIVVTRELLGADIAGERYRLVDAGPIDVNGAMYAWCAPVGDPAKCRAICIDRLLLVKQ